MKRKDPFKQFLRDSGTKISKNMLVMGLPFNYELFKEKKFSKTTQNSLIPNKF